MSLPIRKIASNLLWTPQGIVRNPLLEVAVDGKVLSTTACVEPDRLAATEFYAGLLVAGFTDDYLNAFARMLADGRPLSRQLPEQDSGRALVVFSGLDYTTLRLTPASQIRRIL